VFEQKNRSHDEYIDKIKFWGDGLKKRPYYLVLANIIVTRTLREVIVR